MRLVGFCRVGLRRVFWRWSRGWRGRLLLGLVQVAWLRLLGRELVLVVWRLLLELVVLEVLHLRLELGQELEVWRQQRVQEPEQVVSHQQQELGQEALRRLQVQEPELVA